MRRLVLSSLLVALFLVLGGGLQARDEVKDPGTYIERLAKERGEHFWDDVASLDGMGASAVAECEKALTRHEPFVRIGCAKVLYDNDRKKDAVSALVTVVREDDKDARVVAAELIGTLMQGDQDYEGAKELKDQLSDILDSCTDNALRISLSKSLYFASGKESVRALDSLKELMKSDDPALQVDAAFALAELEDFDSARETLHKLSQEPTDRGRLAALYLKYRQLIDRLERQRLPMAPDSKYAMLDEIINLIMERYVDKDKADLHKILDNAAKGIALGLDPFSSYLTEKDKNRLKESIEMKYGGIGAHVSMRDEWLTIERPVYGGPADRAELRSDDRVVEVGGESTKGKDLEDLVGKLKGEPGTPVTFKVMRRGWTKEREFTVMRERIRIDTAMAEMLPGNIGYIVLTSFGDTTAEEMLVGLDDLEKKGAKALVVDVRNNPGGYLAAAVKIVSLFLEKGKVVVETKGRDGKLLERLDTLDDTHCDLPTVILVNGGSASASEIFSGAMHDHKRATLVGEKTYGKGSVQNIIPLRSTGEKSAMRLTIAKYYLPNGECIHRSDDGKTGGIEPDVKQEPAKRDFWKEAEFQTLLDDGKLDEYVKDHWAPCKEMFYKLAVEDDRDPARYPDFDALFATLKTHLDKGDVRELLRSRVRRFVQDDRKREFLTDTQQDDQLQRAILEVCKKAQIDPEGVAEYKWFVHKFDDVGHAKGK